MQLRVIVTVTVAILLPALFIYHIEGFKSVIVVTKPSVCKDLISDGKVVNIATGVTPSAESLHLFDNLCSKYDNCSCRFLHNALVNFTSNVLIKITTGVKLFSIISLIDLANISIIGHNNPIVNFRNSGGFHFVSCYNCSIEGISWKGCGTRNISGHNENVHPVLQLYNSSNITIKNCSFKYSFGQAVVLSRVSGDVKIICCNFSLANYMKVMEQLFTTHQIH